LEPLQEVGSALPSNSGVNDAETAGQSSRMDVSGPEDPDHPMFADPRNFEAWLAADNQRNSARGVRQSEGALHMRDTGPPGSAALKAEEDDNDARNIRAKVRPKQPTREEVEEREASGHLPYRTWCRSCGAGRGKSDAHSVTDVPEHLDEVHPTVGMDYGWLNAGRTPQGEKSLPGEKTTPILCMRNSDDGWVDSIPMPSKGTVYD
jgi:hypothetical protein